MLQFTRPLALGANSRGLPCFGLSVDNALVTDPYTCEDSGAAVDPQEAYGISEEDAQNLKKVNQTLDDATQAALNAGCLAVQSALGVMSGDVAGVHFSGPEQVRPIALAMAEYLQSELNLAE